MPQSRPDHDDESDSGGGRKLYGKVVEELLSTQPSTALFVAGAIAALGVSQATIALTAASLARALAGAPPAGRVALGGLAQLGGWSLVSVCLIGLFATVVKAGAASFIAYAEARMAGRVGQAHRLEVVDAALGSGLAAPEPQLMASLSVCARDLEQAVSRGVISSAKNVAQLVPLAVCLVWMSPSLAAVGFGLLALFGLAVKQSRHWWRASHERSQRLAEGLHQQVDELVRNADLWRCFGAGHRLREAISSAADHAERAEARVGGSRALMSGANEVLAALGLLGAVAVAGRLGVQLAEGHLLEFAAIFFLAYRPLRDLSDARSWIIRGEVALVALDRLGRNDKAQASAQPRPSLRAAARTLELVGFGAAARGPRTDLTVASAEIVAVTGPTGSGKTTLLRAMLGLERSVGSLRYGGVELASAGVGPAERPFAWVPQDAPLVTGTVIDNVCVVGCDAAAAQEALEQVGAAELATGPAKEAVVGPGGRALSGGQRRQVAIARALASGLPVLLLDEPTEGLDEDAARTVLDAIDALRAERTILVTTHRGSVIRTADRVIALGSAGQLEAAE